VDISDKLSNLKKLKGKHSEPQIKEVERGAIRRWADAIDDPNPLYYDVEYAKSSGYGEIIAPPGFFGWPVKGKGFREIVEDVTEHMAEAGYPLLLDGGMEYEFYVPIHAGDILVASTLVRDISEMGGTMVAILETTYLNQNGDKVALRRKTLVFRPLPGQKV
jgi:acyl dehydratase